MVVVRRRLIFWLIKAYFKKSKKILLLSFLTGLLVFFAILFGGKYIKAIVTLKRHPVIGIVGSYQTNDLPDVVQSKLSKGLTQIQEDGSIKTDISKSYKISENGKKYSFVLKDNVFFNDGSRLESKSLNYNFSDVKINREAPNAITFTLNDSYSPFLVTVSKPVFKKGYIGIGEYTIKDIDLNGNFVQTVTLGLKSNRFEIMKFIFYPTESALKTAFALGEVTQVKGLTSPNFQKTTFESFPGTKVIKNINNMRLVALFYNTTDSNLSDRKIRLALNYALPVEKELGKSAHLPYSPKSIYYNSEIPERRQDLEHAKLLLPEGKLELKITTLKRYAESARKIAKEWEKIGIKTKIEEVDNVPDDFQIFLGDFNVPKDPDQYTLWHSGQQSNITKYKNLRIDKLLEDGRKKTDVSERKKIYQDFQKFLLEDMPASFYYFPYEYDVIRS